MRHLRLPLFILVLAVPGLFVLAQACGSSKPAETHATTVTVTDQGGTATNDQGVVIFVPKGAIGPNQSVTFTIDPDDGAAPGGTQPVGAAWKIGPADAAFAKPITIALPVDPSKLGSKTTADVAIYTAPMDTDTFGPLVTSPYADGNRVSCGTVHLGRFAPVLGALADAGPATTSSSSSGSTGTTTTSTSTSTSTSSTSTSGSGSTSSTSGSGSTSTSGTTTSTSTSGSGSTTSTSTTGSSSGSTGTSSTSSSSGSTGATSTSSSGSGSTSSSTTSSGSGSTSSTSTSGSGSTGASSSTTSSSGSGSGSTTGGGNLPDGGSGTPLPDGGLLLPDGGVI